jgi:DNA repair exonuclease SbcCD ATPase subunit
MIVFEKIRWKNFLSTGRNFLEIDLDTKSSTLISGVNGTGKSTLLDALSFALFGRAFRKINKPQLINSINEKDCLVEVEFSIGKTKYMIRRGMKPNIFEIVENGKVKDKEAFIRDQQEYLEKFILKLNFKSFSQVVVLGSSTFIPFMQLSAADRRFIIEDLLDIQIFSAMNVVLKNRIAEHKTQSDSLIHRKELVKQRINLIDSHIQDLKKHTKERIKQIEEQIRLTKNEIEKENELIIESANIVASLSKELEENQSFFIRLGKYQELHSDLSKKIKNILKEKKFFQDMLYDKEKSKCPTCSQNVNEEFASSCIEKKNEQIEELEKALNEIDVETQKMKIEEERLHSIRDEIEKYRQKILKYKSNIDGYKKYISTLKDEKNNISTGKFEQKELVENEEKLKDSISEMNKLKEQEKKYIEEKEVYELAYVMLKDSGIKTQIVKQYIPIINKLVNKYLNELDFFINFVFDENFNETLKSRHRDVFSYASFSEGQKKRIDLALLFTWREIAKLKNSANTNILILDEVFDNALDAQGIDDFMKLLHTLGNSISIFVISPKGDLIFDKFERVIKFELKNNFSKMEII